MSSTTEPVDQRGQVLVLFAGAITVLFLVAALAFDIGMVLLEHRDQQNAADAAALAGARYVVTSPDISAPCSSGAIASNAAAAAACAIAVENGFVDGADDVEVDVHIPPQHSADFNGWNNHVEVRIQASKGALFAGIMGKTVWPVGTVAVAANEQGVTYSFGMLSLNKTECKAIAIAGRGTVETYADIHANSNGSDPACGASGVAIAVDGRATVTVLGETATCRAVGDITGRPEQLDCLLDPFAFPLPDPLARLPAPAMPTTTAPDLIRHLHTEDIPRGCPGSGDYEATVEAPKTCVLGQGGATDLDWILSPGLYPGGIEVKSGTAYLLPGIYWIGGGGFQTGATGASIISVVSETDLTFGGGVMIYNSKIDADSGTLTFNGGGSGILLHPYAYPFGDDEIPLVIFQDREVCTDVTLNGGDADMEVRGIIYAPCANVKVNGGSSEIILDQIIADTFYISGADGTIRVLRENGVDAVIAQVGLVE